MDVAEGKWSRGIVHWRDPGVIRIRHGSDTAYRVVSCPFEAIDSTV